MEISRGDGGGVAPTTELARRFGLLFWGLLLFAGGVKLWRVYSQGPEGGESQVLELVRILLTMLTLAIIVYSYQIRSAPKVLARGVLERYYPLLITVLGFGLMLFRTPPPSLPVYVLGTVLCMMGWSFNAWAFWHLRESFSIMAEVRDLVTSGPYGWVRHPLYLGYFLNWDGLSIMFQGWETKAYVLVLVGLQVVRARVEERKLRSELGEEYARYMESTGFLFPRFS